MSQPSIIGVGSNSKAYQADSNGSGAGAQRVFSSISIPASTNTVIALVCYDQAADIEEVTSITLGGVTGSSKKEDVYLSPDTDFRATRLALFDVSSVSSDITNATITAALDSSSGVDAILGLICTTGYVESFATSQDRLFDEGLFKAFSGNAANNIMVYMASLDGNKHTWNFSGTGVTDIYKTNAPQNGISTVAAVQATNNGNIKSIAVDAGATGNDVVDVILLICSQPNPFADIDPRGDIISHDIITN